MEISNPRRILILSPSSTSPDPILKALLSAPSEAAPSTPLTTTNPPPAEPSILPPPSPSPIHRIHTPYYTASIPIWTDHVSSPSAWSSEWLALDGAADVVSAVGAWIVAFHKPADEAELAALRLLLHTIAAVVTHHTTSTSTPPSDPPTLFAISLPSPNNPPSPLPLAPGEWDDLCQACGAWEYIDGSIPHTPSRPTMKNEYGEAVGMPRLLEALLAIEWDDGAEDLALTPEGEEGLELEEGGEFRERLGLGLGLRGERGDGADQAEEEEEEEEMRIPIIAAEAPVPTAAVDEGLGIKEGAEDVGSRAHAKEEGDGLAKDRARDRVDGAEAGGAVRAGDDDNDGDGDAEVQALQAMMLKMQAAKEMGADLPAGERRRVAARAVREVMRGVRD